MGIGCYEKSKTMAPQQATAPMTKPLGLKKTQKNTVAQPTEVTTPVHKQENTEKAAEVSDFSSCAAA